MDWRFNTVWFDQIPEERVELNTAEWLEKVNERSSETEYVVTSNFKATRNNLEDLHDNNSLLYLELNKSNINSFLGVSKLKALKRLELHYCLKLTSDDGLGELKNSLEWLHISQSKKFCFGKNLLGLSKLKVLCLNNCGALPDLSFLGAFPNLVDFRFVGTHIESGDLTPLLNHPNLCSTGFLDKRHYNLKSAEIARHLAPKKSASITLARKGQYETFRHLAIGT
jgi:hypothetical protein